MEQAQDATQFGEHNDSIVISRVMNDIVETSFETQPVGSDRSLDSPYGPYYAVKSCRQRFSPAKAAAQVLKSSLNRTEPSLLRSFIQPYVIPGLLPYIELGMENWFCNLSEVTILSAQIGIDLASLQGQEGVFRFNEVTTIIQKVLIQTKGNLIKLFCSSNVTTMVAVWNTHSTSSPESCAQAVCAGKRLMTELAKLETSVCIGVSSGKVFAGVIGVASGRREFSLMGDPVNLANRLMIAAAKSEHLKIIIDEATAHGSQNRTVCKFNEQIRIRSKGELINTYFPEDVTKRHRLALTRAADGESTKDILTALEDSEENLLTHQIFSFQMANLDLFQTQKAKILASIEQKGNMVLVKGLRGVGKSKLVQNTLITARDQLKIDLYLLAFSAEPHHYNEHFQGLMGLYQRLLVFSRTESKDFTSSEEQFLRKFLKANRHCYNSVAYAPSCLDHLTDFVQSISDQAATDLKLSKRKYLHLTELRDCASMVMEALINFLAEAVKTQLGAHIVLVLDNFQLFGQESAKVLAKVLPRVNLTVIGILTVSRSSDPGIRELQDIFSQLSPAMIELTPLSADQLAELFNSYCSARFAEVDCVLSPELSAYIINRTNGNTLTSLSFLDALYCKDYISNRGTKKVTSTERFKEVLENSRGEEFIVTPVTLVREKGHSLNALTINEISVLSLASAFGESFDDNLIEEVNFFPMLQGNNIKTCLERLSKLGLIECLGPQQNYRPYRFTEPIMKNVVYERMLFSQRRLIHKQYREHFKINPIPSYILYGLDPQVQSLVAENTLHFHFTHSSHYKNDKKNYDRLVIELIKANVIHDCRKVSSATEQVFACPFGKFSSDDFKPPQPRYLVVTSSYFSYYAAEDRFAQSPDQYVLRVSHSDIAEVVFSVVFCNPSTTQAGNTPTK